MPLFITIHITAEDVCLLLLRWRISLFTFHFSLFTFHFYGTYEKTFLAEEKEKSKNALIGAKCKSSSFDSKLRQTIDYQ